MTKPGTTYAYRTRLNLPYEETLEKTIAALKAEGFGVLTEIDIQATLKKKLNVDFRKYIILGACNPPLAHQALNTELEIGLLLPCNVIGYEEDGGSVVAIVDPISMLGVVENPALNPGWPTKPAPNSSGSLNRWVRNDRVTSGTRGSL